MNLELCKSRRDCAFKGLKGMMGIVLVILEGGG